MRSATPFLDLKYKGASSLFRCAKVVCLALLLSSTVAAQCDSRLSDLPPIRGVRLGQAYDVVALVLPKTIERKAGGGVHFATIMRNKGNLKLPALKGVDRINLTFLDGKLARIMVSYDTSIKWDGVDEFSSFVSRALNLPERWEGRAYSSVRNMSCRDFDVVLAHFPLRLRTLAVEDRSAMKRAAERLQREEEKKKRAFKP